MYSACGLAHLLLFSTLVLSVRVLPLHMNSIVFNIKQFLWNFIRTLFLQSMLTWKLFHQPKICLFTHNSVLSLKIKIARSVNFRNILHNCCKHRVFFFIRNSFNLLNLCFFPMLICSPCKIRSVRVITKDQFNF